MNNIKLFVIIFMSSVANGFSDVKFEELKSHSELINCLGKGDSNDTLFFRSSLTPLKLLRESFSIERIFRVFLLNQSKKGTAYTVFETKVNSGGTEVVGYHFWVDRFDSESSQIKREIIVLSNKSDKLFLSEVLDGDFDSFFSQEFWSGVSVGSVTPGVVIFERETTDYKCIKFIPSSSEGKAEEALEFFFRLKDVLEISKIGGDKGLSP